ncbi:MAG: PKD domain-containing protein [Bacteroidales bacterium]|nr:PKD domain-containing protein [Bacteroidales bacterium]
MKKIVTLLFVLMAVAGTQAQVITLGQGTTTIFTGCDMQVFDQGGMTANYTSNSDDHVTLYSSDPSHNAVQVEFPLSDFDIHDSDTLFIYDGPNMVDSMVLAILNNSLVANVSSPTLAYAATVRNSTGALTIRLKTDADSVGSGFIMATSCVAPCQRINVMFDTLLSNKYPVFQADSFYYIDVCPYDTLHLVAYGDYPDNNYSYNQNDQTATFFWDLGTEVDTIYGSGVLDHYFVEGRGYDVALTIMDSAGCISNIPQVFRVRTSSNPITGLVPMPEVCSGQELEFTTGYDYLSNVQVDTISSQQATSLAVSDTIFLPDGQDCGQGCAYSSPVVFTAFSPSATIQSANDILYVRLAMEHSFVGDIYIKLTCPNNQYVSIMKKYNGGSSACSNTIPSAEWGWVTSGSTGAYFGLPVDDSGGGCTPTTMGTCWNYCWSNATNQGYTYASGMGRVYEASNIHNNSIDSTNVAQMTQVYHPDGDFSNLIGCPMNGTWSIQVIDGYSIDNGYICGWEMALDPSLLPQDWSYDCTVDTTYLDGPGANGSYVIPDTVGAIDYIINVVDDFGCVYDTTTTLQVTARPQPNLGEDFFICHNDMVTLSSNFSAPNTTYNWNTGDQTEEILVLTGGEYIVDITTANASGTLECRGSDTINVGVYEAPVFDYTDTGLEGCAPLTVRFDNNTTPENTNFEWMILNEDGNLAYSSHLRSPSFEIQDPGKYSVFLRATTSDGCVDSVIRWNYIVVNAQPIAEFAADPEISLMSENNGSVHFINYADSTILYDPTSSFYWDFADGNIDSTNFSPDHVFAQWGDYDVKLHIETSSGCSSEIAHTVVVEQDLIFPNVITPNGDNVNDVFAIENLNTNINLEDPDEYRTNKLYISDRWGKKVYEAKNYDTFSRNGQVELGEQVFDGSGLSDGVYYFTFYYKGKAKTVKYNGSLTIIR